MPSIEIDEQTLAKLRYEAERRGISVARMVKAIVQFGFDEVDAKRAELADVDRPAPSPEFIARAMKQGRKLVADLRELEAAGWPPALNELS